MKTTNVWRAAAADMVHRLWVDWYNGLMLAHPWSRAAHCMVQGWKIRLSQPPAKGNARTTPRPTWRVFALLAVKIALTVASHARRSDWHWWAAYRMSVGGLYIPKRNRNW